MGRQGGRDITLKYKLVILFPSPKYLLGKGYLSSGGTTTESDDVRDQLEEEAKTRGDSSEESRQLGLCSNIVKVDGLLRLKKGEELKMTLHPMMDCEYFISGKAK